MTDSAIANAYKFACAFQVASLHLTLARCKGQGHVQAHHQNGDSANITIAIKYNLACRLSIGII